MSQSVRDLDGLLRENGALRRQIAALERELEQFRPGQPDALTWQPSEGSAEASGASGEFRVGSPGAVEGTEQRLATMIEYLPDATFVIDREKRIVAWNHACEVLTGVERGALLGRGDYAYAEPFYGERRPILIDLLDTPWLAEEQQYGPIQRQGEVICAESFVPRLRGGEGAHLWGEAAPLLDEQGRRSGAIEVVRDITEQKRMEQALRESELKHRTLFETAGDAILLMRRDRFVDCNAQTLAVFGCTREQILGAPPYSFSPPQQPDGRPSDEKALEMIRLASTEGPQCFEWEHCRADRTPFAAEVSLTRLELGEEVLVQAIVRDVSKRKEADARVLRLNRLYATLSRLHQSIVQASDRETLFREACRVAVEHGQFRLAWIGLIDERTERVYPAVFIGHEEGYLSEVSIAYRDEELGRGPTGTAIREGRCVLCQDIATDARMRAWRAAALQRGYRSSAAVPIRQAGQVIGAFMAYAGEQHPFDAEEEELLVEIGQAISHALDGLDHEAERRRAEAALHQLNLELEERVTRRTAELHCANQQLLAKNQELRDFAYTVSHDLKAPLRGIAGYANELERKHGSGLSDRAQFCLKQILTATSHLDQLIEDLLHYSRLDGETPSVTAVNLGDLVQSILRDRDLIINEQHVQVTLEIPVATLQVWERGLVQILTNLIDNAIQYSRDAAPPRLGIAVKLLGHAWQLIVSDNGIGFDMKYHDRIFGLFNRLVRMEDYAGTGAGLAIVKKVVEKQGGRIWAESAPGQGARFLVEIPLAGSRSAEDISAPARD